MSVDHTRVFIQQDLSAGTPNEEASKVNKWKSGQTGSGLIEFNLLSGCVETGPDGAGRAEGTVCAICPGGRGTSAPG